MHYNYEFNKKFVKIYKQCKYPKTSPGLNLRYFNGKILDWAKIQESCGFDALKHKDNNVILKKHIRGLCCSYVFF